MKNFEVDEDGIYVNNTKSLVSYQDHFNDICFGIEDSNFWFNNRNEILGKIINNFSPDCVLADVGGGNGYQVYFLSKKIPQSKFILIEPGYNGCRNARKRGVKAIYNCLAEDFDFIGEKVNAVGLFDVIEHIEKDAQFIKELIELTPSNTTFFIATPSYKLFWNEMDKISGHFRRYDKESLVELGKQVGLEPVYFTYYFSYLTLPYFFFRIVPYWLGKKTSEEDIIQGELNAHKLSIVLKKIFSPFHFIESLLIKNKLTIPFGNSCIAVFKKKS